MSNMRGSGDDDVSVTAATAVALHFRLSHIHRETQEHQLRWTVDNDDDRVMVERNLTDCACHDAAF